MNQKEFEAQFSLSVHKNAGALLNHSVFQVFTGILGWTASLPSLNGK